jgi:hypothetical protein
VFGLEWEEVTGEWKKPHELNDLYCSPNIVQVIKLRRMRWAGHVVYMGGGRRGICRVLLKPEGKKSVGRPRHRVENDFKLYLQEVGCGGMDWTKLAQEKDR